MSLPRLVLNALVREEGLSPVDWAVYNLAWEMCPGSVLELAGIARMSRNTVIASCDRLSKCGWLTIRREGRSNRPVALIHRECQQVMALELRRRADLAANRGEFLMKRYLDLRVNSDEYVDNARPGYLANPISKQRLEYDRLYLLGVAFEFNGPQHHGQTEHFPSEHALRQTQARDLIKQSLSRNNQVLLVTVDTEQLRPSTLESLIPDCLPRRPLDTEGPYFRALAELCEECVIHEKKRAAATK